MRVLLVHNPASGDRRPGKAALVGAFRRAGHVVVYRSTATERWQSALEGEVDVVVAAGGDGTVGSVARALASLPPRTRPPLAIAPLGTANNIARSLNVTGGLVDLAAGLDGSARSRLAVGVASAPWGRERFVESAGLGVVATLFRPARPPRKKASGKERSGASRRESELQAGVLRLKRALTRAVPRRIRIDADGRDLSGEYLLVEAMNISSIGPCVDLAPRADWTDDRLDLVRITPADRPAILAYLDGLAGCRPSTAPIASVRAHRVRLGWPAAIGHLDDGLWPKGASRSNRRSGVVTLEVETALPLLVTRERR